nr:expressed protein [Hymenolepis microstoma]
MRIMISKCFLGYCAAQVIPNKSLSHYQDLIDDPLCDLSCLALKKYLRKKRCCKCWDSSSSSSSSSSCSSSSSSSYDVKCTCRRPAAAAVAVHPHLQTALAAVTAAHHHHRAQAAVLHLPHLLIIALQEDAVANAETTKVENIRENTAESITSNK